MSALDSFHGNHKTYSFNQNPHVLPSTINTRKLSFIFSNVPSYMRLKVNIGMQTCACHRVILTLLFDEGKYFIKSWHWIATIIGQVTTPITVVTNVWALNVFSWTSIVGYRILRAFKFTFIQRDSFPSIAFATGRCVYCVLPIASPTFANRYVWGTS